MYIPYQFLLSLNIVTSELSIFMCGVCVWYCGCEDWVWDAYIDKWRLLSHPEHFQFGFEEKEATKGDLRG